MNGTMSFQDTQRALAHRWKMRTSTLPAEAKVPAAYLGKDGATTVGRFDFCVPAVFAELSLLPNVRLPMLALFRELGIPWHAGVVDGPSNHLLSSQVQCVNALGPFVSDPDRLVATFGDLLGVDEPLEVEPGRFLTFEYIGPTDYFEESAGRGRVRGSMCTSVDAAFLHRTVDGIVELVLIEWKYTERYTPRIADEAKDEVRRRRYAPSLEDPDGPLRADLLTFADLLDEPLYQLMRQQLLANHLECDRVLGAERVRIVHVCPSANVDYQRSLTRPTQLAIADTVSEIWRRLLRLGDRFVSIDSNHFLDPAISSEEYCSRYGPTDLSRRLNVVDDTPRLRLAW